MADNYLEKKMEEYRSGRAAASRHKGPRRGWATVRFQPLTVLVDAIDAEITTHLTALFAQSACTVVCTPDAGAAAGCGARIYPAGTDAGSLARDLAARGEHIDVAVSSRHTPFTDLAGMTILVNPDGATGEVTVAESDPGRAAWLAWALAAARPARASICGAKTQ